MSRATIAGAAFAGLLVLLAVVVAVGRRAPEPDVAPAVAPSPAVTEEAHPGFLYGRVTTVDRVTYEGRLRWGGAEEAFWGDYFNGFKDENAWATLAPPERLVTEPRPRRLFGFEIPGRKHEIDFGRPFMARFGDIERIEPGRADVEQKLAALIEKKQQDTVSALPRPAPTPPQPLPEIGQ